jgi:hypothetical protein
MRTTRSSYQGSQASGAGEGGIAAFGGMTDDK